jgi:hypothetical protein
LTFNRDAFFRVRHVTWSTFNTTYTKRTYSENFFDFRLATAIPSITLSQKVLPTIQPLKQRDFRLWTATPSPGLSLSRYQ